MQTPPAQPIKLYGFELSGHSHRVELALSLFGMSYDYRSVDLAKGEHKSEAFLAKNIFGVVPAIEDGNVVLADSTAILVYLAEKYGHDAWYPADPVTRAEIQRWFAVAAGPLANGPAAARLVTVFGAAYDHGQVIEKAHTLLGIVDKHLNSRDFLVTNRATLADLANYSYIAHAPEGGVDLTPYPNVKAWLNRIESLKGFIPMKKTAVGLAA